MAYEMRGRVYRSETDNPAQRYLQEYTAMYERHEALLRERARLREQTVTGPPQIRQVRGSGRDSLLPSVSSTSRSYSRPMGAAVSSVRQAAFSSAAGRS